MNNFWHNLTQFIFRQRIAILVVIGVLTVLMYLASGSEFAQDYGKIVSPSDPEYQLYKKFKAEFGEDGNVIAIGVEGNWKDLAFFNDLYDFCQNLKTVKGVEGVVSLSHLANIVVNDSSESFSMKRVFPNKPRNQAELDSLMDIALNLPFYKGLIISEDGKTSLIAVSVEKKYLDSKEKIRILDEIKAYGKKFEDAQKIDLKYAGLPVFRTVLMKSVPKELALFLGLSILVTAITLIVFFRSFYAVIVPLVVVAIVVIWAGGFQGLFGYKLTIVTGIIPALITVIGIPNGVYLITKYHLEFARTRNKMEALAGIFDKIGLVTIMTNATTVVGLGATAVTDIAILQEFGIVAGITVVCAFFISMLLIPVIFIYLPEPTEKQLKHLDSRALVGIINWITKSVLTKSSVIFGVTALLTVLSLWGTFQLEAVSHMVDDVPQGSEMKRDLLFMEDKFKGVMPFEVLIDTKRRKGILKTSVLQDISDMQDSLKKYPEISHTLSIADFAKFTRQSFAGGAAEEYELPSKNELNAIGIYLQNTQKGFAKMSKTLNDSNMQKTRISGSIKDVGSKNTRLMLNKVQKDIEAVFDTAKYDVKVTGTTMIFLKGNVYLVKNLVQSLVLTLVLIAILMIITFRKRRFVFWSIIPNILPLLMVAGFMGFVGIPLKPSTALVFSVTFGIAIDNTIHFLAAYRFHRKKELMNKADAISATFANTGYSMIYTSSILFFGFIIFVASSFGGTQAVGYLIGCTLLVALFSNLFFLPALVLRFDKD